MTEGKFRKESLMITTYVASSAAASGKLKCDFTVGMKQSDFFV